MTTHYEDRIVTAFTYCSVFWALLGMIAGVYVAAELVWPTIDFGLPELSFGRLRTAHTTLVLFGDVSSLRVRAEVEERDVTKIRVGQRVVVRADGFPDKDFEGVVTQVAPALGSPRITTRGPRRPNDVEVLEVLIGLDGTPPLLTGMRVDAFFRHEASASAQPATK